MLQTPSEFTEVLEEARRLLGSRLWKTWEGHVEKGVNLSVAVSPSSLSDAFSVSFVALKAGIRPWGAVRAKVGGKTEEKHLDSFGIVVFFTLPAGLAEIELG